MTDILAALKASRSSKLQAKMGNRVMMPDGLLSISDAVFECALYRLGESFDNWIDDPVTERGLILNYLEGKCKK